MSNPKHVNPGGKNRVAVAPYNFVPLPEEVKTVEIIPSHDQYDAELLTGKFTCTLTAASPLYVRAARTQAQYKDKVNPPNFFYGESEEKLLIPGSSLRGMLRNMVEIVSSSKMETVTKKPLFFRTLDDTSLGHSYGPRMTAGDPKEKGYYPLAQAGYMEKHDDGYYIRPAQAICETQFYRVEEDVAVEVINGLERMTEQDNRGNWKPTKHKWLRRNVWFKPTQPESHLPESATYYAEVTDIDTNDNKPEGADWVKGSFIVSGWVPAPKRRDGTPSKGKHRHWIVGPAEEKDDHLIFVDDEDIDLYKAYGGGISQAVDRQKMSVIPEVRGEQVPCFYVFWADEEGKQRVAFGHTAMFRLPYEKTPAELIPTSLRNGATLDLAQSLFGHVPANKKDGETVAGRVFITDAVLVGDAAAAKMGEVVVSTQALSGPKPTTIQHYLIQKEPNNPDALYHYDSIKAGGETILRGHKLYWHKGEQTTLDKAMKPRRFRDESEDPKDRNIFHPVRPGTSFTFTIHFENLQPTELGALLWVLEKAADEKYRLKLGMGKPYGLGSVGITAREDVLTDRTRRYGKLFDGNSWNTGFLPPEKTTLKLENARSAFATFLGATDFRGIDSQERIKEFLTLLSWDNHPPLEATRYMQLGEFTGSRKPDDNPQGLGKRPVLPLPSAVADKNWYEKLPPISPSEGGARGGTGSARQNPTRRNDAPTPHQPSKFVPSVPAPKQAPPVAREREHVERLAAVDKPLVDIVPGDVIWATVEKIDLEEVTLTPANGRIDFDWCTSTDPALRRFKVGKRVLVQINSKDGDDKNGWSFSCSSPD